MINFQLLKEWLQKEKDPRSEDHGSGSGFRSVGLWGGEQPLKRS